MNLAGNVKKVLYGGDYNPEQWPREVWAEDMRLLQMAGVDVVTVNVFSWALLQPSEDQYNFETLDAIIETVSAAGMKICLATGTATHPAWMARKYPDVLRVNTDGSKRKFGDRENSCPNSPAFRKYSGLLARKLAQRYGKRDNIVAWHPMNIRGTVSVIIARTLSANGLKKNIKLSKRLTLPGTHPFGGIPTTTGAILPRPVISEANGITTAHPARYSLSITGVSILTASLNVTL